MHWLVDSLKNELQGPDLSGSAWGVGLDHWNQWSGREEYGGYTKKPNQFEGSISIMWTILFCTLAGWTYRLNQLLVVLCVQLWSVTKYKRYNTVERQDGKMCFLFMVGTLDHTSRCRVATSLMLVGKRCERFLQFVWLVFACSSTNVLFHNWDPFFLSSEGPRDPGHGHGGPVFSKSNPTLCPHWSFFRHSCDVGLTKQML